jgi:four helix bundle protein
VGANTRSSFRSRSDKEFISKASIVIEEADESAYWLELLIELKLIEEIVGEKLRKEADELVAIFTSIVKKRKA